MPGSEGGLTTPRPAAEIVTEGVGRRVLTRSRQDVTAAFERGADAAVAACAAHRIKIAILKDGSPSCGSRSIFDGSFRGRRIESRGVTAARLEAIGVKVFAENELDAAARYLETLDPSPPSP